MRNVIIYADDLQHSRETVCMYEAVFLHPDYPKGTSFTSQKKGFILGAREFQGRLLRYTVFAAASVVFVHVYRFGGW